MVPFIHPSLRDDAQFDDAQAAAPASAGAGGDAQSGLDISNLRCTFSIQKQTLRTPNILYARVYNLAPATLAKVIEFTRVQVSAGYLYGNTGIIFDGTVVQYRRGKENPTDTYLEIHAGDGDTENAAIMFKAWPKGTKERLKLDDANEEKKKVDSNCKVTHIDQKLYQTPTLGSFSPGTCVIWNDAWRKLRCDILHRQWRIYRAVSGEIPPRYRCDTVAADRSGRITGSDTTRHPGAVSVEPEAGVGRGCTDQK